MLQSAAEGDGEAGNNMAADDMPVKNALLIKVKDLVPPVLVLRGGK